MTRDQNSVVFLVLSLLTCFGRCFSHSSVNNSIEEKKKKAYLSCSRNILDAGRLDRTKQSEEIGFLKKSVEIQSINNKMRSVQKNYDFALFFLLFCSKFNLLAELMCFY